MVLDHIAVVVTSLETAIDHWGRVFGYAPMTRPVVNTRQKVKVVFLAKEGSTPVKLVEPTEAASPAQALAARGGGLHHLCFRCANLDAEMLRLQSLGMRVLAPPQPGEAFENGRIAFVFAGQGLNIELIETDRKAGRIG